MTKQVCISKAANGFSVATWTDGADDLLIFKTMDEIIKWLKDFQFEKKIV